MQRQRGLSWGQNQGREVISLEVRPSGRDRWPATAYSAARRHGAGEQRREMKLRTYLQLSPS